MNRLETARLTLVSITLPMVEAVFRGDRAELEALTGATIAANAWPGQALIEQAFTASLEAIRNDPETRLWGDRLMIDRGSSRIVGSVIFQGRPDATRRHETEVAYGVELGSQGKGLATEALASAVGWAAENGARCVRATTLPWHRSSVRVLEKCGFTAAGTREHETLAELLLFERWSKSEP